MFLPDIEINGRILSLQYPLLLDGNLITRINVTTNINNDYRFLRDLYNMTNGNSNNYIIIEADTIDICRFECPLIEFKEILLKAIRIFFEVWDRHSYDNGIGIRLPDVIDVDTLFNWYINSFNKQNSETLSYLLYILDSQQRGMAFPNYGSYFIYRRLGGMENLSRYYDERGGNTNNMPETITTSDSHNHINASSSAYIGRRANIQLSQSVIPNSFMYNASDGNIYYNHNGHILNFGGLTNNIHSNNTYGAPILCSFEDNIQSTPHLHAYDYKPIYIKHVMENENVDTALLLGVELEVGGNKNDTGEDKNRDQVVTKCIQIINNSDSDEEKLIYYTHDSTVQIELDTMPCSLRYHKEKMNYKDLFKYLDEIGYKGHGCESAGLHVHVNRDYLGETKYQQELVISKILYLMEKFNKEICVIARRSTYYSDFPGDKENVETLFSNFDKYLDKGKNAALNLQHPNTIEFRMFKSTLNYDSFINVLDFVACLVDYARVTSIEDIEFSQWEDLMDLFPNNLKKYYTYRFEYESDIDVKKIKKRIQTLKHDIKYCKFSLQRKQLENDLNKYQKKLKDVLKKKKDETSKNVVNHNVSGVNCINNHNHNIVQGQGTGVSSFTINDNDLLWNVPDYVSTATAAITSNIHGIFTGTAINNIEHATL